MSCVSDATDSSPESRVCLSQVKAAKRAAARATVGLTATPRPINERDAFEVTLSYNADPTYATRGELLRARRQQNLMCMEVRALVAKYSFLSVLCHLYVTFDLSLEQNAKVRAEKQFVDTAERLKLREDKYAFVVRLWSLLSS